MSTSKVGNPELAAYVRHVADALPGGSLERLSAGCASVVLTMTNAPTAARAALDDVHIGDVREAAVQFLDELVSLVAAMMEGMATVPPIVRSRTAQGMAYLLEWQELPNGEWGAEIAWMEWNGQKWAGRRQNVLAADVSQIDGQNYSGVPRVRAAEMARRASQREGRPGSDG